MFRSLVAQTGLNRAGLQHRRLRDIQNNPVSDFWTMHYFDVIKNHAKLKYTDFVNNFNVPTWGPVFGRDNADFNETVEDPYVRMLGQD